MEHQTCIYNVAILEPFMTKNKTEETTNDFGQRLAQFRKVAGLTQEELAKLVGTTRRMIAYYETEVGNYETANLFSKMAAVLSITTDELLGLKSGKANGKKPQRRLLRRLQQIEKLPKRDQQALLRTIDGFLNSKSTEQQ